jgi:hypothetical protein
VPRGVPPQRDGGRRAGFGRGEFAGRSFTLGQYEYGGTITVLGPKGAISHGLYLLLRVVLQGDVWQDRMISLTPLLSKWHGTGLIHFVLTPVLTRFLTLALNSYFAGERHGGFLVN